MINPFSNSAYLPLPPEAVVLLDSVSPPPRLVAHLVLVHDVASRLTDRVAQSFPAVAFDREAVLFGAATHDIGKAVETAELAQPGKEHEQRGVMMLQEMGIPEKRARFAITHGNWDNAPDIHFEDLLVALADNCWKGKRVDSLETKTVEFLSSASGLAAWTCYAELDEILGSLAEGADARLAWQARFGTEQNS